MHYSVKAIQLLGFKLQTLRCMVFAFRLNMIYQVSKQTTLCTMILNIITQQGPLYFTMQCFNLSLFVSILMAPTRLDF